MSDLTITQFGDTWINSAKTSTNYGSTDAVHVRSADRRGLIRPALPNLAGRTVLAATLVGHVATATVAQTFTVAPLTGKFSPGKVVWGTGGGPAADTAANVSAAVGALAADATVQWDVKTHLQAVADGTEWYGWRLTTNTATVGQRFRSTDSGLPAWELHITLSDVPDEATDLQPNGGSVEDTSPIVSWTFDDAGLAASSQAQSRVQVDTPAAGLDPDEITPDYDSGWQANIAPEWDLTGRRTVVTAGPHYWRVKVRDGGGNESDWSDWADFTIAAMPTLVVDAPTGDIGDPSPTVLAHLSSGTISYWEAKVTGADRSDIRARTGQRTGAIEWQVPLRGRDGRRVLRDDKPGWIHLRVYPAGDWVSAIGAPTYREAWIPVTWSDAAVVAPTGLTVAQTSEDPRLRWQFMCTDLPEAFIFQCDGETVARVATDDLDVDTGIVTYVDGGQVAPMRQHLLSVRAVGDSGRSVQSSFTLRHQVEGVWLIPDDPAIGAMQFAGTGVGDWQRNDHRATYTTSEGTEVDIIYGRPGRSGQFVGEIDDRDGEDALWDMVDRLEALGESRIRTARLVWGSRSAAVRLRDVDVTPSDDILPTDLIHAVRFGFVEVL